MVLDDKKVSDVLMDAYRISSLCILQSYVYQKMLLVVTCYMLFCRDVILYNPIVDGKINFASRFSITSLRDRVLKKYFFLIIMMYK